LLKTMKLNEKFRFIRLVKKALHLFALIVFCLDTHLAKSNEQTPVVDITIRFNVNNDIHSSMPAVLNNSDPDAYFLLIIQNVSSKSIVLTYAIFGRLHFQVINEKGNITNVYQVQATGPVASATLEWHPLLAPKETTSLKIHYVGDYPFPFPAKSKRQEVTVQAIFDSDQLANTIKQEEQEEKDPAYNAELVEKIRTSNAKFLNEEKKNGLWLDAAKSQLYKVTLIANN
jgi:hypothetical protein